MADKITLNDVELTLRRPNPPHGAEYVRLKHSGGDFDVEMDAGELIVAMLRLASEPIEVNIKAFDLKPIESEGE